MTQTFSSPAPCINIIFDSRHFMREETLFESSKIILDVVSDCFDNYLIVKSKQHQHQSKSDQIMKTKMLPMMNSNSSSLHLAIYCLKQREEIHAFLPPTPLDDNCIIFHEDEQPQLSQVSQRIRTIFRELAGVQSSSSSSSSSSSLFPHSRMEHFQILKQQQQQQKSSSSKKGNQMNGFKTINYEQGNFPGSIEDPSNLIRRCVEECNNNNNNHHLKCSSSQLPSRFIHLNFVITTTILVNSWLFHQQQQPTIVSAVSPNNHTFCFVVSDKIQQGQVRKVVTQKLGTSLSSSPFVVNLCAVAPSASVLKSFSSSIKTTNASVPKARIVGADNSNNKNKIKRDDSVDDGDSSCSSVALVGSCLLRKCCIGPLSAAFGLNSSLSVRLILSMMTTTTTQDQNHHSYLLHHPYPSQQNLNSRTSISCFLTSVSLCDPVEEVLQSQFFSVDRFLFLSSNNNENDQNMVPPATMKNYNNNKNPRATKFVVHQPHPAVQKYSTSSSSLSPFSSPISFNIKQFVPLTKIDEVWLCGTPCVVRPSQACSSFSTASAEENFDRLKNFDYFRAIHSKMSKNNLAMIVEISFGCDYAGDDKLENRASSRKQQALLFSSETDSNVFLLRFFISKKNFRHDIGINDMLNNINKQKEKEETESSDKIHPHEFEREDDEDDDRRKARRTIPQKITPQQNFFHQQDAGFSSSSSYAAPVDSVFEKALASVIISSSELRA